tara:strand:+ start:5453 stop:6796 length:1344 start_codon:yes stop_codon:yes gene_type:complete
MYDSLSYSGRTIISTPLYYYVLALLNLFLPLSIVGKLVPNILISLLTIVVYLTSYQLTKNKNISLLTAFISTLIPIFFSSSVFTLSSAPIIILLIFTCLYCLMRIHESEKYINYFLIIAIILPMIHGTALLLIIGLLFYIFFTKIEGLNIKKSETEIILFSTFFISWTLFLVYKKAILLHGHTIIWSNLPSNILNTTFTTLNILKYISYIGIIPLIFGIWSIFKYVFKHKEINSYKLISFTIAIFFLLIFKLITPILAVSYLSLTLIILSSKIFLHLSNYIDKTKAVKFKKLIFSSIIIIFLLTSLIPTINLTNSELGTLPSDNDLNVLNWITRTTEKDDTILAGLRYGHAINSFSNRKTVLDNNFLYIKNANTIFNDVDRIYQTNSEIEAIKLINKHNIQYILLTEHDKIHYNIEDLHYANNDACFQVVYEKNNAKVYKFLNCKTT